MDEIGKAKTVLVNIFEDVVRFWEKNTDNIFPKEEVEIFHEAIINKLTDNVSNEEARILVLETLTIRNGILMNFFPSEYYKDKLVTQSIFDKNCYSQKWSVDEQERWSEELFKEYGESFFWLGIGVASDFQWQQAKHYFELALRDKLLRRKVVIAVYVLIAWCNAHLHRWEELKASIDTLTNKVKLLSSESKQTIYYLKGYFSALIDYNIKVYDAPPVLFLLEMEAEEKQKLFVKSSKSKKRKFVYVMQYRPEGDEPSSSIKAFPGGLPGLGKRH